MQSSTWKNAHKFTIFLLIQISYFGLLILSVSNTVELWNRDWKKKMKLQLFRQHFDIVVNKGLNIKRAELNGVPEKWRRVSRSRGLRNRRIIAACTTLIKGHRCFLFKRKINFKWPLFWPRVNCAEIRLFVISSFKLNKTETAF